MSHAATKWAFDQPETFRDMKPAEWAVLIVLADCHNPVNGCFPSQDYISSRTNLSERAVRDHLDRLRQRKLVAWEAERENGRRASNRYRLAFEVDFQPAESAASQPAEIAGSSTGETEHEQPADSDTFNRQNLPPNLVKEPVREPVEREARAGAQKKTDPVARDDHRFVLLMARHPGINDPGMAFGAFERLTEVERTQALERHDGYLAIQRAEGRNHNHALTTYLGKKLFEQVPDPKAEAAQTRVTVEPRTKQWWGLFWRRFKRGDRVGFMLSQAADNHAWSAPLADLPSEAELSTLVSIEKGSPEWEVWEATILRAGRLSLRGDSGKFIFVPSEWPAGQEPIEGKNEQEEAEDDSARS